MCSKSIKILKYLNQKYKLNKFVKKTLTESQITYIHIINKYIGAVTHESLILEIGEKLDSQISTKGLHYALSNGEFIDLGWTVLPQHKILREEKIYYALPTRKAANDWLARNECLSRVFYDNEVLLAQFDKNGTKIFYRSGQTAIDISYYPIKDIILRRLVLREDGCEAPLGILDTLGRGIIYDHAANIRLKYNQLDAVLMDPTIGIPRTWKWIYQHEELQYENIINDTLICPPDEEIDHLVNYSKSTAKGKSPKDKPKKETPKTDTPKTQKNQKNTEPIQEIKEIQSFHDLQIKKEINPYRKTFKIIPIKPVIIKISNFFSLIISDQQNISLIFRHDRKKMRIELGVTLVDEFIKTDLIDSASGATMYEEVPPRTESIAVIHKNLNDVRIKEANRVKRSERLRIAQGKEL